MHILISNDDGIFAPGIRALVKALLAAGHRVTVYAPDEQRSAAGRAMSLHNPLTRTKVELEGAEAYAVNGTPVDCMRLGLYMMRDCLPDFAVSGINLGPNRGAATGYSGTIGAAMEASLGGVPALASSLCSYEIPDFDEAAKLTVQTVDWARRHPLPRGEIYSLNVPLGEVRGVCAASLSNEYMWNQYFEELPDGRFMSHRDPRVEPETDPNSDLNLTEAGYATISVLSHSMLSQNSKPDLSDFPEGVAHNGMEIERKYLIRMPDTDVLEKMPGCECWDIRQTYLHDGEKGETRRVRRIRSEGKEKFIFTCKRRVSDLSHVEQERELTRGEYEAMLSEANPSLKPICKRRFRIPFAGHLMEIDVYDFWNDRATLEIELESEDESAQLPPWIDVVREVTGDKAYKNRRLAKHVPDEKI